MKGMLTLDKQELIEFLKENLRIKLEESDLYANSKAIRVELILEIDGREELIDSDSISI